MTDTGRTFAGTVTVYRGTLGEDPRLGISWTVLKAKARWFAESYALGPRGQWLRLSRADGESAAVPTVWRGLVEAENILGYFGTRRESEVVIDPETVKDVEPIWRRRH